MTDPDFKPKLGRLRDGGRSKSLRHSARILGEAGKAGARTLGRARNSLRQGPQRGLAAGALAASGYFAAGARRAIVKARYTKMDHGAAHLRYILRDGITRDGQPGLLYDASADDADGRAFLARFETISFSSAHHLLGRQAATDQALIDGPRPHETDARWSRRRSRLGRGLGEPQPIRLRPRSSTRWYWPRAGAPLASPCRRAARSTDAGCSARIHSGSLRSGVETPARFTRSSADGAYFGITPRRYQSGEVDKAGRISKCSDSLVRDLLYEAAKVLLSRSAKPSDLQAWGRTLARRNGSKKATMAVALKLSVTLHRMWTAGEPFRWTASPVPAAAI
jgi:Transposase IS116/IS110/IS902 family